MVLRTIPMIAMAVEHGAPLEPCEIAAEI